MQQLKFYRYIIRKEGLALILTGYIENNIDSADHLFLCNDGRTEGKRDGKVTNIAKNQ